jgi:hypothetical protein
MELLTSNMKIPLLTGIENFFEWQMAARNALCTSGVEDIITRDAPIDAKEEEEEVDESGSTVATKGDQFDVSKPLQAWIDKDMKARGILHGSLSNELRMDTSKCTTAKQLWNEIQLIHELDNEEYQADIERHLLNLRYTPSDDPKVFLSTFSTLILKGQSVGLDIGDKEKCKHFSNALHSSYSSVKRDWRSLPVEKRVFAHLRSLFNRHNADIARDNERDGTVAMFTKRPPFQEWHLVHHHKRR